MPVCRLCVVDKMENEFSIISHSGNRRKICRECTNFQQRIRNSSYSGKKKQHEAYLKQKKKNPGNVSIRKRYGITQDQYSFLLDQQKGLCALCGKPPRKKKLAVDHCHKTRVIRGLLCNLCNAMLGRMNDDPGIFLKVVQYLQEGGFATIRIFVPRRSQN